MTRIHISPAPPRPSEYDVVVSPGALGHLPELVAEAAPAHHYALVADETVAAHYGARVSDALRAADMPVTLVTFPAGEETKTRESWAMLSDRLFAAGMGRDGAVVALGGGVTGDLAGFVAATFMRGVPLVQVPTTLLAMVDASIGGKTGVDTPAGKNLVGAFHQPRLVVVDPEVLRTLPERELRSGLAETVKHGAIADAHYLRWIEREGHRFFARDPEALGLLIRRSIEIKAEFVARDPLEAGPRKALNFGHTVGHAVETLTGYAMPHGYAVAIGMVAEAMAGEDAGITDPGTAAVVGRVLASLDLPTSPPGDLDPDAIVVAARSDKKARQGRTRYTLLARPGAVARTGEGGWSFPLEEGRVRRVLQRLRG